MPLNEYVFGLCTDQVWSGVIVIHEGAYQDGIFKFTLSIPDEYPSVSPRLRFLSNVYHPLVGESGEVEPIVLFIVAVCGSFDTWCVVVFPIPYLLRLETPRHR